MLYNCQDSKTSKTLHIENHYLTTHAFVAPVVGQQKTTTDAKFDDYTGKYFKLQNLSSGMVNYCWLQKIGFIFRKQIHPSKHQNKVQILSG